MKWLVLGDIGRHALYHVGDEAMACAAVDALQARGATEITLVGTDAEAATELYGLPALDRIGISPAWSTEERDDVLARARSGHIDPGTPLAELDAAVAATDAVLISGGGNMNTHYAHHIDERAVLTRLARRHETPLVVAAQTIGPHLRVRDRKLVAEIIDYATAFAVRDDSSYHLALQLGADAEKLHRISDDAVLLTPASTDRETATELAETTGAGTGYVAASFTSTPGNSGLDRHEYLDLVAATLDRIATDLDTHVLLVPHLASHFGPAAKFDELSDASIAERCATGRIHALPAMTARVAVALTAGAALTVSTRYHPLVFAPAHGVPAIGISLSQYSTVRMRGALEPAGLEEFLLGPTSWETAPAAAREITQRHAEFSNQLQATAREQLSRQNAWWDRVAAAPNHPAQAPCPPQHTAQLPARGTWSAPAARALAQFDQLDATRGQIEELHTQLAEQRRRTAQHKTELTDARRQVAALTARTKALTRRAERAERRRAVRAMDTLGGIARTVLRRGGPRSTGKEATGTPGGSAGPTGATGLGGATGPTPSTSVPTSAGTPSDPSAKRPLLSVLIPVYNVADYLEECLSSVVNQTLKDLQIILIDDGSTDASAQIAARFAAQDERIQLIHQENRGLGAVRNRGVSLARGEYLTFLDSDDTLPRDGLRALVDSLEHSGADLAIGGIARIQPDGSYRTTQWVRDLHDRDRHTSVAEEPALLRDYFTWNKVYRTDFFTQHGFRFREGVLFEDQPVITEILCRAAAIDVLAQTTYHYRIRPDDSALTGNMGSTENIHTRHQALTLTKELLDKLRVQEPIRQAWLWTLAESHLPAYLKLTAQGSAEQYTAVREMVGDFLTTDLIANLPGVNAAHRVLCHLALTADRGAIQHYLAQGGTSTGNATLERRGDGTVAHLPVPADTPIPEGLARVDPAEQRLRAVLDDHTWYAGKLVLQARVGVAHTVLPQQVDVSTQLVTPAGQRIPLPTTGELQNGQLQSAGSLPRPLGVPAWYAADITADIEAIQRTDPGALADGAHVELHVTWDEHTRTGVLGRRHQAPGALELTGSVLPDSPVVAEVTWTRSEGVRVRTVPRAVTAGVQMDDGARLGLQLSSSAGDFDVVFVALKVAGLPERRTMVRRTAPGEYRARVDTSWLEVGQKAHLVAIDDAGRRRNVHVSRTGLPEVVGLLMTTTPGARLRLLRAEVAEPTLEPAPAAGR